MHDSDTKLIDDPRLAALAPCFDLVALSIAAPGHLVAAIPNANALTRWPNFPSAAQPSSGRVAMGCGLDAGSAARSGLGEAAELAQTCVWGDEIITRATIRDLAGHSVSPGAVNGFSADQTRERDAENDWLGGFDWVPPPCPEDRILDWITAEDASSGLPILLPADAVLLGRRAAGDPEAVAIADSNGCACGRSVDSARLSALLELVERDAAARWWYGQRKRPLLAPERLGASSRLLDALQARSRGLRLFDITTDLGIPAVAAASFAPDGTTLALGFAARLSTAAAAQAALLEMLAVETTLPPARAPDGDAAMTAWLQQAHMSLPALSGTQPTRPADPPPPAAEAEALQMTIRAVLERGCRLYFVDQSRADWNTPVARAVSPDLCPLKPRFGRSRLWAPDARDLSGPTPWPDPARPLLIP